MNEMLSAREALSQWVGSGASYGAKRNAITAMRACAAGGTLNVIAKRAVRYVDVSRRNLTGRPVETVEDWVVPPDLWLAGSIPSPSEVSAWEAGNDVLTASKVSWRLSGLMFPAAEIASLAPPHAERGRPVCEKGYWHELEAENQKQQDKREQMNAALLNGEWIRAADALNLMMNSGDRDSAGRTLIRYASIEQNKRPLLRTRVSLIQNRDSSGSVKSTQTDCIIYGYQWSGSLLIQQWATGLFEIKSDVIAGHVFTLAGVLFSLDDLKPMVGRDEDDSGAKPMASRRRKFDQDAFIKQAVEILKDEGGFGPHFLASELHAAMESWCNERWPSTPSRAWIYARFDEAEREYRQSLSNLS